MDFGLLWGASILVIWILTAGEQIMSDRLYEFIITGTCVAVIVAGAIFGTWALLVTMSW